jgi:uncharacterized small protein (DUF1192 family)
MRSMSAAAYQIDDRDARIAALEAEIADLRALLPPKPPKGWTCVKRAEALSGYSAPTIYRMRRQGLLVGTKLKGRVYIDPSSIRPR